MSIDLRLGDCMDVLRTLPSASIDACVTDPPYGLTASKPGGTGVASLNTNSPAGRSRIGTGNGPGGFMGMKWDTGERASRRVLARGAPGPQARRARCSRSAARAPITALSAPSRTRGSRSAISSRGSSEADSRKSLNVSAAIDEEHFKDWLDAHPAEHAQYLEQMRQAGDNPEAR